MASVKIDERGNKLYYNENRRLHREDGPAYINLVENRKEWWVSGTLQGVMQNAGLYVYRDGQCWISYVPNGLIQIKHLGKVVWPELK